MYCNNIVNFQESTTILNAWTKKSGNLLNAPRISFYRYLIAWTLICDHWFHAVFILQSSGRRKKDFGEIEKIETYSQKNVYVRIAYNVKSNKQTHPLS